MSEIDRVPAVAVCIPLYNKRDYIAAAVDSVLGQTFGDLELVVIDNGSDDGSSEAVTAFDDPRMTVVRHEVTVPPIENFNRAVASTRAPLVKMLCADDILYPECLERQVGILAADDRVALVACRQDFVDGGGNILEADRGLSGASFLGRRSSAEVIRHIARHGGNPIGGPGAVLFRRAAFDAAGGWGAAFSVSEVDLWARLLEHGDYVGMDETLTGFRFPDGVYEAILGASWLADHHRLGGRMRRCGAGVRAPDTAAGLARLYARWARHNARALVRR